MNDELLDEKRTAEAFDGVIDIRTLQRWRQEGRGPVFLKLGKRVAYRRSDLDEFLNRSRVLTAEMK